MNLSSSVDNLTLSKLIKKLPYNETGLKIINEIVDLGED
jgi:hypothetical protein